jgi:tetratricopeptide (TPR) repeat protein
MARCLRFALIPLLLFAVACSRDPKVQSQKLVENGNKFFDKTKYREATIMYRRALTKDPKNGDAYYRLGLAAIKLQAWDDAARALRRAVDIATEEKKENVDATTKLADIYWTAYVANSARGAVSRTANSNLLPEVRELSESLLKRNANSFDGLRLKGYLLLADAHDAEGNREMDKTKDLMSQSVAVLQQANRAKPNDPQLGLVLASALDGLGRQDEGEALSREVIAHDKTFSQMYDLLLVKYLRQNRIPDAENLLREKIRNNPGQDIPRLQLAAFYQGGQRKPEMEQVLSDMVADKKDFPMARLKVGGFFARLRDFDRARREYEAGITEAPKEKAEFQKAIVELLSAQGKYAEATVIVNDILKADPKDSVAIELRSALAIQSGDTAQINAAITDLQGLVAKSPTNHMLRFELGRAMMAKGQPDQARTHLEEALRLRPGFDQAKLMLAQIYSQKGDNTRALQYADQVISNRPRDVGARLIRTASLMGLGDRSKAKEELEAMIKTAPETNDARYQLGYIHYMEGRYKEAEQSFSELRQMAPSDLRGMVGMVESEVAMKNYAAAIQLVEKEIQKDPDRLDLRFALATVLARAGQYDESIKQFQTLVSKNPKSAEYEAKLGEVYRIKGDFNSAIDHFRKASILSPNDVSPLVRVAILLDSVGRRAEAKPIYEQVVRLQPDNPMALNNLAFIKAEEGTDLDQAMSYAQRAKQKVPQDPNISDTLGWIYIKKNLSDEAVRLFRELVTKSPNNSTYRYHLAMALFQKGDRASAKDECQTALKNNPSKEEQSKIKELLAKLG